VIDINTFSIFTSSYVYYHPYTSPFSAIVSLSLTYCKTLVSTFAHIVSSC